MKPDNQQFDSPLPGQLGSNPAVKALSHVYGKAIKGRQTIYDRFAGLSHALERPVISVGGIRAGGTGKTPVSLLVGRHLINAGFDVAFLSRGYGRPSKQSVIIKPEEIVNWELTGDEPYMLRNNLRNSWLGIGADRVKNAKKLLPLMPERPVFVLDDGFQYQKVKRDLDIVCLSENTLSDRMIPAGFLREPLSALERAGILFIIGDLARLDALREVRNRIADRFTNKKCAVLLQQPLHWVEGRSGRISENLPIKKPIVVCGIARPERFINMLRSFSIEPYDILCFKDHHNFKRNDLTPVLQNVYSNGIVTTEKDCIRLQSADFADIPEIWYLKIGLRFADDSSELQFTSELNRVTQ
ncbi:MAG: tetraacyldisaccharide 4'-kinase [Chitinispirillales bacterium]|nr:tetraacyldisaccharide 4'-kinase [Chitinispirillales bacterium]